MTVREHGVVVVDPSPEAHEAARCVARVASDRDLDLLMVPAYDLIAAPPVTAVFITVVRRAGQRVLDQAMAELDPPAGPRVVETLLDLKTPVSLLRTLARFAARRAAGGRPPAHDDRLGSWTYSVARAVLLVTRCPLVIVPQNAVDLEDGVNHRQLAGLTAGR